MIIFNELIGQSLNWPSKISFESPTISKILSSTSIKTSRPIRTETSSKDRQIWHYSIGLTILGKLCCANMKRRSSLV